MTASVKYRIKVQFWQPSQGEKVDCLAAKADEFQRQWGLAHAAHGPMEDWRLLVYEAYASDGAPLYVGQTQNFKNRMKNHRYTSSWWPLARSFVVTMAPCTEQVRRLEWRRIRELRPSHNKARNPDWVTGRVLAVRSLASVGGAS